MKVRMTGAIQSIIIAVKDYRKWRFSNAMAKRDRSLIDKADEEVYSYFKELDPASVGFDTTRKCFEEVIRCPIEGTLFTQEEELPNRFQFGW